jgi:hypothetical protein
MKKVKRERVAKWKWRMERAKEEERERRSKGWMVSAQR